MAAKRVILDTDIGTDVDDAFALAFLLGSPELTLDGVTVVYGDVDVRARLALRLLQASGHRHLPVALGRRQPLRPGLRAWWAGHESEVWDTSGVDLSQISSSGAEAFILEQIEKRRTDLALVAIGPLSNIGALARDCPRAFQSLDNLSMMGGNFMGVHGRSILPEHNFKSDPEAADIVLQSGAPARMVGINITKQTSLSRSHVKALRDIPTEAAQLLATAGEHYLNLCDRDSTPMHDSTAVAALTHPEIFTWRTLHPRVQTEGSEAGVVTFKESLDPGAASVDVATDIDLEAFQNLFWQRIHSFAQTTP